MLAYQNLDRITPFYGGEFSNWWKVKFTVGNAVYNCEEQHMMAVKADMFGDNKTLAKIMLADHPREQKALGRQVVGFNQKRWEAVARHVVFAGCWRKFQHPELFDKLCQTRGTLLVEASPVDLVWGVGLSEDDPDIFDKSKWRGTNWLGEVLTDVRYGLIGE